MRADLLVKRSEKVAMEASPPGVGRAWIQRGVALLLAAVTLLVLGVSGSMAYRTYKASVHDFRIRKALEEPAPNGTFTQKTARIIEGNLIALAHKNPRG
jgi:CBS domain containing-hemolysin-like protein